MLNEIANARIYLELQRHTSVSSAFDSRRTRSHERKEGRKKRRKEDKKSKKKICGEANKERTKNQRKKKNETPG